MAHIAIYKHTVCGGGGLSFGESLSDADKSHCALNPDAGVFLTSSYGLRHLGHPGVTLSFLPQQRNNYVVITNDRTRLYPSVPHKSI